MNKYLQINKEVSEAMHAHKGIVALESTIISHGMPYPRNVEVALKSEEIIRQNGAVPATIAIINGKMKVGLNHDEIEFLGKNTNIIKASRRDLAALIAKKQNGATTVASTMIVAGMCNIKIFATGGIGGVHRGAEKTMDISADLQELAHTNIAVVCAGAKSILNLEQTLEYLETFGVPVVGVKTDELPAFYIGESGLKLDYRFDDPIDLAQMIYSKWQLKLNGGVVVANPIPEADKLNKNEIEKIIQQAIKEAAENNIKGKFVTPFLLDKIEKLTNGKSLEANVKLVYNNAKYAAQLAVEFVKL